MLDADRLLQSACESTGLDDLGEPGWRTGLDALVDSANGDARLHELGELVIGGQIDQALRNRLEVVAHHVEHPELRLTEVEAPVFVLGLPRTGTTLLSYLLDRDPANRSLLRWECFRCVPPPVAGDGGDTRIGLARAEMDALYEALPAFRAIHYEAADGPTECVTLLAQDFRCVSYETMANLRGYGHWLDTADLATAYRWHRAVLQVLQRRSPGRWTLKSPCHNLGLPALVAAYPDARFVVTHRDPVEAVGSLASLVAVLSGLGTGHDFDRHIGARWLEIAGQMTDRCVEYRDAGGDERFHDIAYASLVRDPMQEVAELYDALDWELTGAAERSMRGYLADSPKGRFGRHEYDAGRFGLDAAAVRARLAGYSGRFGAYLTD